MRLLAIAVVSVVLFFPLFWALHGIIGPNWAAGVAAFAMYVAFPVVALKLWSPSASKAQPTMEAALASGQLRSVDFHVTAAAAVEELEDEGKHFYLAISPNETVFLSGQYLYDPVARGEFPSTHIRVHSHKTLGFTYGVECLGEPLLNVQRLPPFSEEQFRAEVVPEDRQSFACALAEVVQRGA